MDENKKKMLEEKLRRLIALADKSKPENKAQAESKLFGVRVIRRRKGAADLQTA